MFKNTNKSSGQISRLLLVLSIIVFVAAIIVYLIMRMAEAPSKPIGEEETVVMPVYEQTLSDIKFIFQGAINHGDTLYSSNIKNSTHRTYKTDLTTKENFIEVKIGAQNMGKLNTRDNSWDIENIIDSEGREFVPLEDYSVSPWLPEENLCGTLLKPAFDPTPCIKIYEVSKKSTGLKIRVTTKVDNKEESALIDLIVSQ